MSVKSSSDPIQAGTPNRDLDRVLEKCVVAAIRSVQYHLPTLLEDVVKALAVLMKEDQLAAKVGLNLFRARSVQFSTNWLAGLHAELQSATEEFVRNAQSGVFPPGYEATLPGLSAFEQQILLDRIGARLTDPTETEFQHVGWRLANLVHVRVVKPKHNPFRPAVFVRAFMRSLKAMEVRPDHLLPITKVLDFPLTVPLRDTYRELNKALDRSGVPLVRGLPTPPDLETNTAPWSRDTSRRADAALQGLYEQLPAASGANDGRSASQAIESEASVNPRVAVSGGAEPGSAELAATVAGLIPAQLERFDRGDEPEPLGGFPALDVVSRDHHGSLALVLVKLVFERIGQDPLVHRDFRNLILYLQFPVLHVSLVDHRTLLRHEEPVRCLVDQLAAASFGWLPASRDSQELLAAARVAVREVLARGGSHQAFAQALQQFEAFVRQTAARLEDPVARAKRALAEAEERQAFVVNVTIEVGRALQGVQVEPYLREFLLKRWVGVIVEMVERENQEPGAAQPYRDVVKDLVWSVQPKLDRNERARLTQLLPSILRTLRQGMEVIDMPAEESRSFMAALMQSHSQAMRTFLLAYGISDTAEGNVALGEEAILEQLASPNTDSWDLSNDALQRATQLLGANLTIVRRDQDAGAGKAAASTMTRKFIDEWQKKLIIGSTFDWAGAAGRMRLQLRWVSPRRSVFLFSDAAWKQLFSFSPAALADKMRSGELRPSSAATVFQDAMEQAVTRFGPQFLLTRNRLPKGSTE
jgi:hypothetical protein